MLSFTRSFRAAFELLDHSYEVGKELRVHLLHCPAAVNRGEAPLQLRDFFLLFAPGTISLQSDANSIQQVLVAEWLGKKFACSANNRQVGRFSSSLQIGFTTSTSELSRATL